MIYSTTLFAGPANPDPFDIVQPDGTKFKAQTKGDEWYNWIETEEGYTVIQDKDTGRWYYAIPDEIEGIKMGPFPVGKEYLQSIIDLNIKKGLRPIRKKPPEISVERHMRQPITPFGENTPLLSPSSPFRSKKILVIMVDFTDRSSTYSSADFQSLFFSTTSRSVYYYFNEVSYGKVSIEPASETHGSSDGIVGWLRLSQTHPNCGSTYSCNRTLASSAIQAADPYVNFSQFDTNGDGSITADELVIIIVVAGFERSYNTQTPNVWAHAGTLSTPLTLDGKSISRYAMIGEAHGNHQATLGIIVHELGHSIFSWPDLYDVDGSSKGIGYFDLMASGSWGKSSTDSYSGETPVHPSAWTKIKANFITPTVVSNQIGVTLPAVSGTSAVIVKVPTQNVNEYFLLENRYFSGYDAGLQGRLLGTSTSGGLAIWHIDESVFGGFKSTSGYGSGCWWYNSCNANEQHKIVDLEEADASEDMDNNVNSGRFQDLFYSGNNSTFNNTSNPNSMLYNGEPSNVLIANISNPGSVMTLDISASSNAPAMPTNLLSNSDFESGTSGWVTYSSIGGTIFWQSESWAFGGSRYARLGNGDSVTEYIYQDIAVPADVTQAYLQFGYYVTTQETTTTEVYDTMAVEIRRPSNDTLLRTVLTLSNLSASDRFKMSRNYDVSEYIGQSIRLRFYVVNDSSLTTYFRLDDVGLLTLKEPCTKAFFDVPPGAWYANYVNTISCANITTLTGYYYPSNPVTRDQMAAFIVRAILGEKAPYITGPYFSDVSSTHWAFKYVQKLKELGITTLSGYYYPNNEVTRDQMAAFIIRAKLGEDFTYSTVPYFTDVPASHWAFKYVQKLKELGITTLTGSYYPNLVVSRDQMSAFISRAFLGIP